MLENSIRREGMRLGSETIHTDEVVAVRCLRRVIATVPAGARMQEAFELQPPTSRS